MPNPTITRRVVMSAQAAAAPSGPDPSTASAVVAGAGTESSNGTYARDGDLNGRARYTLGANSIFWSGAAWFVNDTTLGSTSYRSNDDVAYPWLVTTWLVDDGSEPVPTVSIE